MSVLPLSPQAFAAGADRTRGPVADSERPPKPSVDCSIAWSPAVDDERHRDWLDAAERERYARLRLPAARARFVTGRAVVRTLLGAATGTAPRDVLLVCVCPTCGGPHGRPAMPGAGFDVSITHSGDLVGVAIIDSAGGCRVGLDVEDATPSRAARGTDLPGLCAVALACDERAAVLGQPHLTPEQRWRRFTRYWCRKEAVVKADGAGLELDLTAIAVSAPDAPAGVRRWPGAGVPTLQDVAVPAGRTPAAGASWSAAVCVLAPQAVRLRVAITEPLHLPDVRAARTPGSPLTMECADVG